MTVRAFALHGSADQLQAFRAALDVPEQGGHGYGRQDVVAGRALVEEFQMACWRQGVLYLEIAPSRLPDRAAARVLAAALGEDPQRFTTAERVEMRQYASTGDFQAYEEWESRALARA
jgi:hypothetical protein